MTTFFYEIKNWNTTLLQFNDLLLLMINSWDPVYPNALNDSQFNNYFPLFKDNVDNLN